MNFKQMFGDAQWIGAPEGSGYITVRDYFDAKAGEKAEITILGFGRFILFVNGKRAHDDYFLPLNSFFEHSETYILPENTTFGTRAYPCKFDISSLIHDGKNNITVMLGGGWYTGVPKSQFGLPKLCYKIELGKNTHYSSTTAKYSRYFVEESHHIKGEIYDFKSFDMKIADENYDDSSWDNTVLAKPLGTELYEFSDCPTDKLIRKIKPTVNEQGVYDASLNLTGFPVLVSGGGDIEVTVSEDISPDGNLDENHIHNQQLVFKNTKKSQILEPLFTWLGFRYFKITGNAEVECVKQIHADVNTSSTFDSDNETLNWIYNAFIHTMLSNMHSGQPSDCPHLERRGYTGDGQLSTPAVFRTLDAKEFYKKWIADISDCQNKNNGHVQNTAPYVKSGGGPGGWGIAIIKVPYEYWKYYGDDSLARLMFPQMMYYLDYMENHCDFGLVTRTEPENAWCLGDWCLPYIVAEIPPSFVNTYFYIKGMQMCIELAKKFGHTEYIGLLSDRIEYHKKAINAAYFHDFPRPRHGCQYLGGNQGANAFALDIGLGNEDTVQRFINKYDKLDAFDTGMFGTEIVTRLLFKYGRGDIAIKLLCAEEPYGFGAWKKQGATSLWEYWRKPSRSLSHPMFGAVVASFYDGILGIEQCEDSAGYAKVKIAPPDIKGLDRASGSITTPRGVISVSYERKEDGTLDVKINAPEGIEIVK